jgi:hypothetical protein
VDVSANDNMPQVVDLQLELLAQAFACDLTRVASLQLNVNENNHTRFSWLFSDDRHHHEMSHTGSSDTDSQGKLAEVYRWYAEQVATLADRLAAIPEGDGTVLDNTLIVWGTEIGIGNNHRTDWMPFVLVGGAGGALETGRYLTYEGDAHNRLLVSVAQMMGLEDVETYGSTDGGRGPLARL